MSLALLPCSYAVRTQPMTISSPKTCFGPICCLHVQKSKSSQQPWQLDACHSEHYRHARKPWKNHSLRSKKLTWDKLHHQTTKKEPWGTRGWRFSAPCMFMLSISCAAQDVAERWMWNMILPKLRRRVFSSCICYDSFTSQIQRRTMTLSAQTKVSISNFAFLFFF
jgi:hypothetical protein